MECRCLFLIRNIVFDMSNVLWYNDDPFCLNKLVTTHTTNKM